MIGLIAFAAVIRPTSHLASRLLQTQRERGRTLLLLLSVGPTGTIIYLKQTILVEVREKCYWSPAGWCLYLHGHVNERDNQISEDVGSCR